MWKKSICSLLFLIGCSVNMYSQESQTLDTILCDMHDRDQSVREELGKVLSGGEGDLMQVILKMNQVDAANQKQLEELLEAHGWPNTLSSKANQAVFLVIDHAPLPYAEKYLPLVKEKEEAGVIQKSSLVTLEDRILMKKGEKQLYGTQTVSLNENGKDIVYIWPVEDPETLDERRLAIGLPTMSDYMKVLEESYNQEVKWDNDRVFNMKFQ